MKNSSGGSGYLRFLGEAVPTVLVSGPGSIPGLEMHRPLFRASTRILSNFGGCAKRSASFQKPWVMLSAATGNTIEPKKADPETTPKWPKSFLAKSREKKTININNFSGLAQEWVGVKSVDVLPFSWENGKHINKISRKSQANAGTVPG